MGKKTVKTTETAKDPNVNTELLRWYIVGTYSGHEKKAAEQIKQRIKANGLEDEVTDVLVPVIEKTVAKGGQKRSIEEKIFPGYVLIRMIMNDATWHIIRNTEGVTGFVGATKKPTPLSEEEVAAIKAFTEVKQSTYQSAYQVGDSVRVIDGPFKDFIGVIQEVHTDKGQVTVLLSIFGRETPVHLDFLQVTNL
jgi:transcriptional antiterminator NusG